MTERDERVRTAWGGSHETHGTHVSCSPDTYDFGRKRTLPQPGTAAISRDSSINQ